MVSAYAQGAKGVMFVPQKGEKTLLRMMIRSSNDNDGQVDPQ